MDVKNHGFNLAVMGLSLVTVSYLVFPLTAIFIFIASTSIPSSLGRPEIINAFLLSASTATVSTTLLLVFGIPVGYLLARFRHIPGVSILRLLVFLPLVLPPLASGALLLGALGPISPIMRMFPMIDLTQSVTGIIIAQTYVASPFMIFAAEIAFESYDESLERVSRLLGKSRFQTFVHVSIPLAKNGIIIGSIMSWVRAVGELGATMMLAYNPHTISIQIFEDNAIGGLARAIPDIFLSIILSITALTIFWLYSAKFTKGSFAMMK